MIRAKNISFAVGDFRLHDFTLEIAPGSYFVILGPPGSGKTIFLECLCGLKTLDSGTIHLGDTDVTNLEPRARNIGYVPQDYALFPHLSVRKNITFGMRGRGLPTDQITRKVDHITQMLGISQLLDRTIPGLSGGEKQRTALARALVMEPRVLLLDEPVCALDESTRQSICALLHRIQRQLNLTVVHVSHNLEEAFSVADSAAVLNQGTLHQVGALDQLLREPANEFVARFMRCENIFPGRAAANPETPGKNTVDVAGVSLTVDSPCTGAVKLMIRPEDVLLKPFAENGFNAENTIKVEIVRWRDYGGYMKVEVKGPVNLTAHMTHAAFAALKPQPQSRLIAVLNPENLHLLPN